MRLWLTVLAVLAALGGSERAFTASNGVAGSRAGAGTGAISGYAVSGVHYELDDESIASVSFALAPANAATVRIRLSPAGPWHACSVSGANASCATAGVAIAEASQLHVVAAG